MHPDDPQHAGSCHLMKEGHWTECTVDRPLGNIVVGSCPGCTCGALSAWAEKNIPEIAEKRRRAENPIAPGMTCPRCGTLFWDPHSTERCDTVVFRREALAILRDIRDRLPALNGSRMTIEEYEAWMSQLPPVKETP